MSAQVQKLASTALLPGTVALSDTDVFWIQVSAYFDEADNTGSVHRVAKAGGEAILIADKEALPTDLVVAGGVPYWTDLGTAMGGFGSVANPKGKLELCACDPTRLTADSTNLYWAEQQGSGVIRKASLAGGAPTIFEDLDQASGLASDGVTLFEMANENLSATSTADPNTKKKLAQDMCGGDVTIVLDDTSVFWSDSCGDVYTVPKAGGATVHLGGDDIWNGGHDLAVDDTFVYWLTPDSLVRVDKHGGAAMKILALPCNDSDIGHLGGIAVDATTIYWAAYGGVWRTPKP